MEYPYFKGLEADRYSFYRVPKALVKADLFQKMSGDAKLLYAVLLDRMSLSIKNGWQDKHNLRLQMQEYYQHKAVIMDSYWNHHMEKSYGEADEV